MAKKIRFFVLPHFYGDGKNKLWKTFYNQGPTIEAKDSSPVSI